MSPVPETSEAASPQRRRPPPLQLALDRCARDSLGPVGKEGGLQDSVRLQRPDRQWSTWEAKCSVGLVLGQKVLALDGWRLHAETLPHGVPTGSWSADPAHHRGGHAVDAEPPRTRSHQSDCRATTDEAVPSCSSGTNSSFGEAVNANTSGRSGSITTVRTLPPAEDGVRRRGVESAAEVGVTPPEPAWQAIDEPRHESRLVAAPGNREQSIRCQWPTTTREGAP